MRPDSSEGINFSLRQNSPVIVHGKPSGPHRLSRGHVALKPAWPSTPRREATNAPARGMANARPPATQQGSCSLAAEPPPGRGARAAGRALVSSAANRGRWPIRGKIARGHSPEGMRQTPRAGHACQTARGRRTCQTQHIRDLPDGTQQRHVPDGTRRTSRTRQRWQTGRSRRRAAYATRQR